MKQRIIIFRSDFLPSSETFILDHARSLADWDVHFFTNNKVSNGLLTSFHVSEIPEPQHSQMSRYRDFFPVWKQRMFALSSLRKARAKVALVHFGIDAVRIWPFLQKLKIPTLVFLHGYDITTDWKWWFKQHPNSVFADYPGLLLKLSMNKRVGFLASSQRIRQRAIEFGIDPQKITVTPLGVDTDLFPKGDVPMAARNHVLFVGRLVEKKGCRYLIDAFSIIQDRFPGTLLRIIGEGELSCELQNHARTIGCRSEFLGYRSQQQISEELRQARVFCLPSVTAQNGDAEGLPIVLLEAQSSGVPILTSAKGAEIEGMIPGVTGYAFPEKDVAELSSRLSELLQNAQRCEDMGSAGREYILGHRSLEHCSILHDRLLHQHSTR